LDPTTLYLIATFAGNVCDENLKVIKTSAKANFKNMMSLVHIHNTLLS